MKIKFNKILDGGNPEDERILFTVLEDCNLGNYMVALSKKTGDNRISNQIENIKWLEDVIVKAQDIFVIYTHRKGEGVKTIQNSDGSVSYFQFWNLSGSLNSYNGYNVVCFEATWKSIDYEALSTQDISGEGE
jgi:hypothetical protein